MKIYMTRDSVAAGDDADAPHTKIVNVPGVPSVDELLRRAVAEMRLPSISGGRATWCLSSRVPLLVLAQQWTEPRTVSWQSPNLDELDATTDEVRFHFSYLVQIDPEMVLQVLQRLQLNAL